MTRQQSTNPTQPRAELALTELDSIIGGTMTAPHVSEVVVTKRLDKPSTRLY